MKIIKKLLLLTFIAFSQLSLGGQNLISNGDFEDHQGTMETMTDWYGNSLTAPVAIGGDTWVAITDNVGLGGPEAVGFLTQSVPMYDGAEYTLSFTLSAPISSAPDITYPHLLITVGTINGGGTQEVHNLDIEDYAGNGTITIEETFSPGSFFENIFIQLWELDSDNPALTYTMFLDDFSLVTDDLPTFHFENAASENVTSFCNSEHVFMNAEMDIPIELYHLDSWRRKISHGPDAEFEWDGSLGWTEAEEIGTINLSTLFDDAGAPFKLGYEYQIKLAIQNESSGWLPTTHEFKYTADPQISFHFEDGNENENTFFCNDKPIFLNGGATTFEERYKLIIYENDLSGSNGFELLIETSEEEAQLGKINLLGVFANYNEELLHNHEYKVKVWATNDCSIPVEVEKTFVINAPPIPKFHFVDSDDHIEVSFCTIEEVILDGSDSQFEEQYKIAIYDRPINSGTNFILKGTTPWFAGEINEINLDAIYQDFGYEFVGNYEYKVRLYLANECSDGVTREQTFKMFDECCFPPQKLDCNLFSGDKYLTWDRVPLAQSYTVQITYNDCCQSTLPQFSTQYFVDRELRLEVPNVNFDCFSWKVIVNCGNDVFVSQTKCFNAKTNCTYESQQDDRKLNAQLKTKANFGFKVFPNPTADYINIQSNSNIENVELILVDAAGRIVLKTATNVSQIDTQSFDAGIYFLLIKSGENILHRERVAILK